MAIIGGFDLHRRQLTYDYLDVVTGQVDRGRVVPADRSQLRSFLARFEGQGEVAFAVEGCTGWRYVVEELERAGIGAQLAEPAETAAKRGRKRRAKTDGPTPAICGSCWPRATCLSRGSRRCRCLRPGRGCGCIRTWRRSARRGCSGSRPPCTTRACRSSPSEAAAALVEHADAEPTAGLGAPCRQLPVQPVPVACHMIGCTGLSQLCAGAGILHLVSCQQCVSNRTL